MNSERCWGGLDEQFPVGVDEQDPVVLPLDEQDPDRSSRLELDEQDPVEGWMNSRWWRAGGTITRGGVVEQEPVERAG